MLPRIDRILTRGLNTKLYTQVPTHNRQQFLQDYRDKEYFRVYRTQVANPLEQMPFAFPIGKYVKTRDIDGAYEFDNDGGSSWVNDDTEIYMIGSLDQRGGKTVRRRRKTLKSRKVKRQAANKFY